MSYGLLIFDGLAGSDQFQDGGYRRATAKDLEPLLTVRDS